MEKYKIERKIIQIGNSKGLIIPEDILKHLNNAKEVFIMPDKCKHGNFLSIFNKKQQKNKKVQ